MKSPAISVDIVFFDIEDYGQPNNSMYAHQQGTWCLGSQYWGKQAQQQGYKARYGILLDMVGGKNATFLWEYYSSEYARDILSKVWSTAATLGYGRYFLNAAGDPIQDDHYYMNELAGVPTIDIIQLDPVTQGFGYYHHRHADNMQSIDKFTLKAVGQTIMEVLYTEK